MPHRSDPNASSAGALTVESRFNGPPTSANGGYASGLLAGRLGTPAVRVTLRSPPPLDTAMAVERAADGSLRLMDGVTLVAEAVPSSEAPGPIAPVPPAQARRAQLGFGGLDDHPFPTCFTCGTERASGDGLRLFAGPVGAEGTVACTWIPRPAHELDGAPTGRVPAELVWAALDCPGGWSSGVEGRPIVLGRMTAAVRELPEIGRPYVVVGELTGAEGRKMFTATTLYGEGDRALATATSTWITI